MKNIDLPLLGTSAAAAGYMVEMARTEGVTVGTEFNGTPMWASISCSTDQVVMRWYYERLLIQIANGVVNVRDYADSRYVRT